MVPPRGGPSWLSPGQRLPTTSEPLSPAAAAKSLQSCPTLCDPIDRSPPGSAVAGILQARTLEWVAISFPCPLQVDQVADLINPLVLSSWWRWGEVVHPQPNSSLLESESLRGGWVAGKANGVGSFRSLASLCTLSNSLYVTPGPFTEHIFKVCLFLFFF